MDNFSKSEKEIYKLRKQKIAFLNDISEDSFPTKSNESVKISKIIEDHKNIKDGIQTGIFVSIRGRLLNARSFGKLLFYDILDQSGKIQLLVNSGEIQDVYLKLFENFDIGDIIAVNGEVIKTKKGELSIKVSETTILSKSLRTFPEKWHGLKDKETRFRQRYLDLIVNPESKKILEIRSKVIRLIREYLYSNNFMEVETPILQSKAGGALAKPFMTHHNALGIDMYLRIAPELYLKRLVIGGFEKVFELGKIFRNEGIDQTHMPEFTMLESYQAYVDANSVMDMVEDMCLHVFENLDIKNTLQFGNSSADFSRPWKRISMFDMVSEKFNIDIKFNSDFNVVAKELKKQGVDFEAKSVGLLVYELFENYLEKEIINPIFVTDYPIEVSPFAREKKAEKGITERFELFAFGSELANGFSELIDSEDQANRLKEQAIKKNDGEEEAHVEDEDYIEALQYGLPPTGGLGFGIDRFVMMLVGKTSIREVISFSHLKPEN